VLLIGVGIVIEKEGNVDHVHHTLEKAKKYGLQAEVMWSALTMAAEANEHGKTMKQVLDEALSDWDI